MEKKKTVKWTQPNNSNNEIIDRMGFSTFSLYNTFIYIQCISTIESVFVFAQPIQYELVAAGDFIVQYKNDYVKLGSIVDCVFFICIHIDTIEKCVEFNSHVKCRKVSSAKYEEKKKKRESNRIKLVSFFFSFIPFYLRMFFCQSPICMRIPICYSNLSTSLTSDD